MTYLSIENLGVTFGSKSHPISAVDDVSLDIPQGDIVGVVGESGSGKSTLGRATCGLVAATAGRILLDGVPSLGRHPRGRRTDARVQMVFQDPSGALNPRMTVAQSIAEGVAAGGAIRNGGRRAEVERLLGLVAMDGSLASALPAQLSGGQRQRVALARALAASPDILVMDEITSALDVSVQGVILNLVREIVVRGNLSMIFISHNLAVVGAMCDRIVVMRQGSVVEAGEASAIVTRPQHPYTQQLIAAIPEIGRKPAHPS